MGQKGILLLTVGALFTAGCQTLNIDAEAGTASTADWIAAWSTLFIAIFAPAGLFGTLLVLAHQRSRQRLEVEAYIRVDIGPLEGTTDFPPPKNEVHAETKHVTRMGGATEQDPVISVWFTNRQTHHLGFALGFGAEIVTEFRSPEGKTYKLVQSPRLAYIEPEKIVRVDLVRFPADWRAESRFNGSEHRSIYGDARPARHGRWECHYENRRFKSIPVSDPPNLLHDPLFKVLHAITQFIRLILRLPPR